MLDIILLYFLAKNIGRLALKKGLPPLKWKLILIGIWLTFEMAGIFLGFSAFGDGNLLGLLLMGLASAFGGYFVLKANLEKYPDAYNDDEIAGVKVSDLYPERK